MTLFFKIVHESVVLMNFTKALELLNEFIVEITHLRTKEATSFSSKTWLLNIVAECIGNLLKKTDLKNSIKRHFLRILADSDLASVDSSM